MDTDPTPFDSDTPPGERRLIIRRNPDAVHEIEMVEAAWGSDPRFGAGVSYRFARADGVAFSDRRCLIPASEFHIRHGDKRYRVALDSGNFFYLAGICEPAMAGWPISYRIITVDANHEVSLYQERHGAIIQRRQVLQWLDDAAYATLLVTPPPRTFRVEEISAKPVQTMLAL